MVLLGRFKCIKDVLFCANTVQNYCREGGGDSNIKNSCYFRKECVDGANDTLYKPLYKKLGIMTHPLIYILNGLIYFKMNIATINFNAFVHIYRIEINSIKG